MLVELSEETLDKLREAMTPVERRLFNALADGKRHHVSELHKCLKDDRTLPLTVNKHMCTLRKPLQECGLDVISQFWHRRYYYRLIACIMVPTL